MLTAVRENLKQSARTYYVTTDTLLKQQQCLYNNKVNKNKQIKATTV
jgi:hypothetical protein